MNIPNRIALLFTLLLLPAFLIAQTNIAANKVIIKDSLSINSNWIKRINSDSTLPSSDDKSISVDGALKKYIQHRAIAPAIVFNRTDSVLTLDTGSRALAMTALPGAGLSDKEMVDRVYFNPHGLQITTFNSTFVDSLRLQIISSDSIITPMVFGGNISLWAYGKPPFSIKGSIINRLPHSAIWFSLDNMARGTFYSLQQNVYPGDTMNLDIHKIRGWKSIILGVRDTINENPGSPNKMISMRYTNKSEKHYLATIFTTLPPGESTHYKSRIFLDNTLLTLIPIRISGLMVSLNGDLLPWSPQVGSYRVTVLKNGLFYKMLTEQDIDPILSLDNTWDEVEITLEDN